MIETETQRAETPVSTPREESTVPPAIEDFTKKYLTSLILQSNDSVLKNNGWICFPYQNEADPTLDQSGDQPPMLQWLLTLPVKGGKYPKLLFFFDLDQTTRDQSFGAEEQDFLSFWRCIDESTWSKTAEHHNRDVKEFDACALQMRARVHKGGQALWSIWSEMNHQRPFIFLYTSEWIYLYSLPSMHELLETANDKPAFIHQYLPSSPMFVFPMHAFFVGKFRYSRDDTLPHLSSMEDLNSVNADFQDMWKQTSDLQEINDEEKQVAGRKIHATLHDEDEEKHVRWKTSSVEEEKIAASWGCNENE